MRKLANEHKITIEEKFQKYYGAYDSSELEKTILRDGYNEHLGILKVWRTDTEKGDVLVDGHHRLDIYTRNGIPFEVEVDEKIHNEDDAIEAIIQSQIDKGRERNDIQRKFDTNKLYEIRKVRLEQKERDAKGVFKPCAPSRQNVAVDEKSPDTHPTANQIGKDQGVCSRTVQRGADLVKAVETIEETSGSKVAVELLSGKVPEKHIIDLAKTITEDGGKDSEIAKEIKAKPETVKAVANREKKRELPTEFKKAAKEAKESFLGYENNLFIGYIALHEDHFDFRYSLPGAGGGRDIAIGKACLEEGLCGVNKLTKEEAYKIALITIEQKYRDSNPVKDYMRKYDLKSLLFVVADLDDNVEQIKIKIKERLERAEHDRLKEVEKAVSPEFSKELEAKIKIWEDRNKEKSKISGQESILMLLSASIGKLICPHCQKKATECLKWECNGESLGIDKTLRAMGIQIQELTDRNTELWKEITKAKDKAEIAVKGGNV